MIAHVDIVTGLLTTQPGPAPETWRDPATGISESCFRNWTWPEMYVAGWREAVDAPLPYDPIYEQSAVGAWYYDDGSDTIIRDYSITDRPIEEVRAERLAAVRAECRARIESVISVYHQLDVAMGIIPDLGYTSWITSMITESNRCEDLYVAAINMNDLKAVIWGFPAYVAP